MAKVCFASSLISGIHGNIMKKINGKCPLGKNERVITAWRFENRPAHAGQILNKKILPNGNTQLRITTAFAGDTDVIATDTKVMSPSGKLLNQYYGIRGGKIEFKDNNGLVRKTIDGTRVYSKEPEEILNIIKAEQTCNPDLKTL